MYETTCHGSQIPDDLQEQHDTRIDYYLQRMKRSGTGYTPIVRKIMFALPGVTEGVCHGTIAFYVNKKLLSRMKEDGKTLVVYTPDRDEWTVKDNITFYITDHYRNYPYVLVDLIRVKKPQLTCILTEAWKSRAGKKLLEQFNK